MEKLKVVFHISESKMWRVLLANIRNLIKDMGKENIIIEVVANVVAVVDYVPTDDQENKETLEKIGQLSKVGVHFTACRNSLLGNNIEESILPTFVTVVPAGVTQLVKRQSEGYSYIKL
ncbi:MAG: hypothetical protein GX962_08535 [Epulopiscium sp.]|nr:hypothetical protein [Candidatus Epulonipiscium sp.]